MTLIIHTNCTPAQNRADVICCILNYTFTSFNVCNNCAERDSISLFSYLNNHLDGGQGGRQVLRVRGSDSNWHTASIQAAVEGGNQVDS